MPADRRRLATILALVVVAAVLVFALRGRQSEPPRPEDLIWRLVEAAQGGDIDTYLGCFGGALRGRLDAIVLEMTPGGFADYLRSSSEPLTGVAVYDVEVAPDDRASLTVEYVYRDATERQRISLALGRGGWAITDLEGSRRAKPLIPYGAPAAPMPEPIEEPTAEQPMTEGAPP